MSSNPLAKLFPNGSAYFLGPSSARFSPATRMKVLEFSGYDYATGIAGALKEDFGESMSTIKSVCEVTGATPGTVKKWFAEENGPGGEYLVKLMYASPAVRRFIDTAIHREDQLAKKEQQMRRALALLEGREDP